MSDVSIWVGFAGIVTGGAIAVSGQIATARIARSSAEAAIEGARDRRLWEKRATAYVDAVREVLARRTRREALTSRGDTGNIGSHPIEEGRKAEEPEIIEIRAVLRAYASPAVWLAYEHADEANTAFWTSLMDLASANSTVRTHEGVLSEIARSSPAAAAKVLDQGPAELEPLVNGYQIALRAMEQRKAAARAADEMLFDAISRELGLRSAGPAGYGTSWHGVLGPSDAQARRR